MFGSHSGYRLTELLLGNRIVQLIVSFPTALPGDGKYPARGRGSGRDAGTTGSVVGHGPRRLHREVQGREPGNVQLGDQGAAGEGRGVRQDECSQRNDHQPGAAWVRGQREGVSGRGGGRRGAGGGETGGGDDRRRR